MAVAAFVLLVAVARADRVFSPREADSSLSEDLIAFEGYDPVAYFPEFGGRAVKGLPEFSYDFPTSDKAGNAYSATFLFSLPQHLATFASDPWRYAPRWGGF